MWGSHCTALKVSNVTPARLRTLAKRAQRALAREEDFRARMEQKLKPLADARRLAEHEAWKTVLDAYAVAKAQARLAPDLVPAFAFMSEALARPRPRPDTEELPVAAA